jgi:hypothetical protein
VSVQRLSGGLSPAAGGDPRTFPQVWNATATVIDGVVSEAVRSADVRTVVALTQAEYDDIAVPDSETLYVITD